MRDYIVVIPARYASTRLPGKPLIDILGKGLLYRTYLQCLKVVDSNNIVIATDDERIVEECKDKGMNWIMTSPECKTGTDRVAEVATKIEAKFYINVQGDEPVFNPDDLASIIESVHGEYTNVIYDNEAPLVLNGYTEIRNEDGWRSYSTPKVIVNKNNELMYMSRSPIPNNKYNTFIRGWRQVCIYAFNKAALDIFSSYDTKQAMEEIEDIEILRFIEHGVRVKMIKMSDQSIPVDSYSDITKVVKFIKKHNYDT